MRASLFAVLSMVVAGGAFHANASPLMYAGITSTPEPDAMVLMGVALIALSLIARKRRNSRQLPKTRNRAGD